MRNKKIVTVIGMCLLMTTVVACIPEQAEQDVKELVNDFAHANGDRTAEGMQENSDYWNKKDVYNDAKAALEQELDCPSTAVYPAYDASYVTENADGTWTVRAYVDAQNLMGAMVRIKYQIDIEYNSDGNGFTYWFQPLS